MNDADRVEVENLIYDVIERTGLMGFFPDTSRENIVRNKAQTVPSNVIDAGVSLTEVEFTTIYQEISRGFFHHSCLSIYSQAYLNWWWSKHHWAAYPEPPTQPTIDFATEMMICACRGRMPTWGYTTAITHVIDAANPFNNVVERYVTIAQYDPWGMVKQEYSYPNHIIKVAQCRPTVIRPVYYWVLTDQSDI